MDEKLVRKVLSWRWALFAVLGLAYFFVYFHRLSLSVVADDLARDFKTTASVLGLLGSVYFYCYAAMQFPAGLLSDSVGPRKTVTFSLLLAAAGSLLFGLAPGLGAAFAGRVMVGLGVSMVFIPTMKILSQWFRAGEFAVMAGLLNAVGGAGVLAGTWLLGLLATQFGWRTSFQLIAGCTVVILVLVWLIVRDRPADKGWPCLAEIDGAAGGDPPAAEKIGLWAGARQVVSEKHFWPIAVWFFFDCGIFFGSLPDARLRHEPGTGRQCPEHDRLGHDRGQPAARRALGEGAQEPQEDVYPRLGRAGAVAGVCRGVSRRALFSVSSSAIVIMGFTATKELFPVEIAGTSVGTVNLFPFLGGAVFMPLLGRILDAYPHTATDAYPVQAYRTVLAVLLVASILALACTLVMKDTFRR